jgi:hypothetical protein
VGAQSVQQSPAPAPNAKNQPHTQKTHKNQTKSDLGNDVGASETHDAGHLHRVPASAAAHHVAVERVENTLVRQLQRVVQHDHVFDALNFRRIAARLGFFQRFLLVLVLALVPTPTTTRNGLNTRNMTK